MTHKRILSLQGVKDNDILIHIGSWTFESEDLDDLTETVEKLKDKYLARLSFGSGMALVENVVVNTAHFDAISITIEELNDPQ